MANSNTTSHVVRGKVHWAKVLGEPRLNTFSGVREHSIDLTPNAEGLAEIKRIGLKDKLRDPKDNDTRKAPFITFRHKETWEDKKTGEAKKNAPIRVKDAAGGDWPANRLIGNGSTVDIKFQRKAYGPGKPVGVYIQAVRVLDLVEFEMQDFAPLSADDQFFATGGDVEYKAKESDVDEGDKDLDDDIPF